MKHLQWIMLLSHCRKVCSNIPNLWLFVIACWWYTRYSAHTVAGTNYSRECTAGTEVPFSPRNYPLPNHFLLADYAFFPICVAFLKWWHIHAQWTDKLCKSVNHVFSALFLDIPPSCILCTFKPPCGFLPLLGHCCSRNLAQGLKNVSTL